MENTIDKLSSIFSYKRVLGVDNEEYILFLSSEISDGEINLFDKLSDFRNRLDRTGFEALENHVHIVDKVKKGILKDCVGKASL